MTDLIPFEFEGKSLRVVMVGGQPWWVVSDVALHLQLANPAHAVAQRVDSEDRNTITIHDSNGGRGNPTRTIVNESGLYALVLSSQKPEAKRFKRWITSEVLPEIRKWGFYNPTMTEDEKEIELARKYLQATIERAEAKRQLAIAAPLAARHELLQAVDGGYNVASVGRALGFTGRIGLFWQHLITVGAIQKDHKERSVASEEWIDLGYMVVRGMRTPVITEEGLQRLESLDLQ